MTFYVYVGFTVSLFLGMSTNSQHTHCGFPMLSVTTQHDSNSSEVYQLADINTTLKYQQAAQTEKNCSTNAR
ncbi:MAG: hypothetical protein LBQ66_02800 [Planctomycetaceae bacterium]|nr:hypothetical protein [Planctomycetaceae bacterium]